MNEDLDRAGVRAAFSAARAEIERARRTESSPQEVCRSHAQAIDATVASLFAAALERLDGDVRGAALLAVGGYGRMELAPGSDLDLLLVVRGWTEKAAEELNRAIFYPLWDSGREIGNRLRTPKDVIRSLSEPEEAAALLDARFLAGDRGVFLALEVDVDDRLHRARGAFGRELVRLRTERVRKHGHAGYALEPEIREAAGALRDIHSLAWAGRLLSGRSGMGGLVDAGMLTPTDVERLEEARSVLLGARVELHLLAGRKEDRLTLERQPEVAERLGYAGLKGREPADELMQRIHAHARFTAAVCSDVWEVLVRRRPRLGRSRPQTHELGDGCVLRDGRIEAIALPAPRTDAVGWLRAFRHCARTGARMGRDSLARLRANVGDAPPIPWTGATRSVFLDILDTGPATVPVLEEMDASGLLVALIPEWSELRCLPQRDPYHRYTVDVHLFRAVAELSVSRTSKDADVDDAWSRVTDPLPLFVATLLHDIGKGYPGDHIEVGAPLAEAVAERMGLVADDVQATGRLVREHMLLPELALHRDLDDPATLAECARRAGGAEPLAMLYLLARADALATGPDAWSPLRASLIRALYARTLTHLGIDTGGSASGGEVTEELEELARDVAPGRVRTVVRRGEAADELTVVTGDRAGLLATVCGILALRGIDVHAASIRTYDGGNAAVAAEWFRVSGVHGPIADERWTQVRTDIEGALAGGFDVEEALRKKSTYLRPIRVRRSETEIVIDNRTSERHTIVEVRTQDRFGLMRSLVKALADAGCDIHFAKIATYGLRVVDVFYVRDRAGGRVDGEAVNRLEQILRRAIDRTAP